ncbi:ATP synthase subunit I [Jannaschia seohaensis]|uniref:F1/F0 ATPase, subunit 2 n=1 Tax=Jannaschia seohaensis TaxID=475081 RepID=A0A2Y9B6A3_9RHOB|nr:ATP synthase subunit I [Jannaschia seohaensis]PWJ09786.1 F1F0 ATPase subunit 2 [Jannaschia seohaensis]SSA51940.1 F1/F0 ATPase, subunit 2 [Jannaschia seohaensis]
MADPGMLALSFAGGMAFGAVYLALIWSAAQRIAGPRPVLAFVTLALARAALLLGSVIGALAMGANATGLLSALAGFVVLRVAATGRIRDAERRAQWK